MYIVTSWDQNLTDLKIWLLNPFLNTYVLKKESNVISTTKIAVVFGGKKRQICINWFFLWRVHSSQKFMIYWYLLMSSKKVPRFQCTVAMILFVFSVKYFKPQWFFFFYDGRWSLIITSTKAKCGVTSYLGGLRPTKWVINDLFPL